MAVQAKELEKISAWLERLTPMKGGRYSVEIVPEVDEERLLYCLLDQRGELRLTLRLVTWEEEDDKEALRMVQDIKEQQVWFLSAEQVQANERLRAYLEGWARAVEFVLARGKEIETLLPFELVFPQVFALKRPKDAEDFFNAFGVRSRMGRYITG